MKIKYDYIIVLLVTCWLWTTNGCADDFEKYIVPVQLTNGLTLGISIGSGVQTNTTEMLIELVFKAPTNTHSLLYVPKDEYLARLELLDLNNHTIAKTELGSKYGLRYDALQWDIQKYASRPRGPIWFGDAWGRGCSLPKTSELFAITNPGTYRLRLEVQVMLMYLNMADKQVRQIVRFPRIEITVTRPESPDLNKIKGSGRNGP